MLTIVNLLSIIVIILIIRLQYLQETTPKSNFSKKQLSILQRMMRESDFPPQDCNGVFIDPKIISSLKKINYN